MERLRKIGMLKAKNAADLEDSRFGLGMEKLDRDAFNPDKAYDKVAALGVKWIRIQSGWQKTEKEKGVYDFSWLDEQVDNLLSRKLKPWLCLCYGNKLYDDFATQYYGAVGCAPIRTQEAYEAWLAYCKATVLHFKGRIEYYEIWNEPDGVWCWKPAVNVSEYADFAIKTGRVIKENDSNAKVITGSHCDRSLTALYAEMEAGMAEVTDAITYHEYTYDERYIPHRVQAMRVLCDGYKKGIEIIQGESGSQSKSGGAGALYWIATNEKMQAKQLARHTMADILAGVKFTSTFSCVDIAENLQATEGTVIDTYGWFGVLSADFDKNTGMAIGEYKEKKSYYCLQNLCSVFDENVKVCSLPLLIKPKNSPRIDAMDCNDATLMFGGLQKKNGAKAFVYWNSTNMLTTKEWESTVSFQTAGITGKIHLIDVMDGCVYTLPDSMLKQENGMCYFTNVPIKDYPLIITFGDFYTEKINRSKKDDNF